MEHLLNLLDSSFMLNSSLNFKQVLDVGTGIYGGSCVKSLIMNLFPM